MPASRYRGNKVLQHVILFGCVALGLLLCHSPCRGQSALSAIWLSPAPSSGRPQMLENEHIPQPTRSYLLHNRYYHSDINAVVRRPNGKVEPASVQGDIISFKASMGDGPAHGAHNLYVTEKWLENDTLVIRVAKWITMHHSCGWGHDHKFDEQRITPQALPDIPLEIVPGKLWDSNFHASLRAGDILQIQVLSKGRPLPNAGLTIRTSTNWTKLFSTDQDGAVTFQLINDYIPSTWPSFKRTHRMPLMLTASYSTSQSGVYKEQPYSNIQYVTTLPWHYQPARSQYSSYGYGLLIGSFMMVVTGMGIYAYRGKRRRPCRGTKKNEQGA